jgi:quercetin dioxygenase-like cupin family protein
MCQSPHWGYVLEGVITATYSSGEHETVSKGDLFYWPPGHTVKAEEDTDLIMFSPQAEHSEVIDHVLSQVSG